MAVAPRAKPPRRRPDAQQFYSAVADQDGAAACALLSADTRTQFEQSAGEPCPQAIVAENLPPPDRVEVAQVYRTTAYVRIQ